jgi:hypothetical protein
MLGLFVAVGLVNPVGLYQVRWLLQLLPASLPGHTLWLTSYRCSDVLLLATWWGFTR